MKRERAKPKIRDAYSRPRVQLECEPGKGETQQHFKDEVDINNIIRKFQNGGELTHINEQVAQYGDATSQGFTEAMYLVKDAERAFMELPSQVRREFGDSVTEYLDAIGNPEMQGKLADLGLIEALPVDKTMSAETPPVEPSRAAESQQNDTAVVDNAS